MHIFTLGNDDKNLSPSLPPEWVQDPLQNNITDDITLLYRMKVPQGTRSTHVIEILNFSVNCENFLKLM